MPLFECSSVLEIEQHPCVRRACRCVSRAVCGVCLTLLEDGSEFLSVVVLERLGCRVFDGARLSRVSSAFDDGDHVEVGERSGVEEGRAHLPAVLELREVLDVSEAVHVELAGSLRERSLDPDLRRGGLATPLAERPAVVEPATLAAAATTRPGQVRGDQTGELRHR